MLGGSGFFGNLIIQDLLEHTGAYIVIAARHRSRTTDPRVRFVTADLRDRSTLEGVLDGAFAIIHCAGPYDLARLSPLDAAIKQRIHYLDLAEGRDFVRRVQEYDGAARLANVAVFSGLSVIPGLAALLVETVRARFDSIDAIRTFVAPGTRGSRGPATVHALLSGVARTIHARRGGREVALRGWSEGEWVSFPSPLGWRRLYLALESADFDLFPRYFGTQRVEFKAGSEFVWLNRSLALIARVRARTGVPQIERWTSLLRKALRVLGIFGTDAGGVSVEVSGSKNCVPVQEQIAVTAERNGERIPAIPAALAISALLGGEISARGIVPLHSWIAPDKLFSALSARALRLWRKQTPDAPWQACHHPDDWK